MNVNFEELLANAQILGVEYGLKIITALILLVVGKFVINMITKGVRRTMAKSKVDETILGFVANLVNAALLVVLVIMVMARLGIQTTSFIAVLGAAGLAIGLALQGSLSNFAAGFLMIIFRPFKVGDYVEAGGVAGVIQDIQIFTTTFTTPDNRAIIVPNSAIMNGAITNVTTLDTRRVDLVIGISYDADIKQAKEVIENVVKNQEGVLKDPACTIAVSNLGDSSVDLVVRPWVKTADYWTLYFELTEKIKYALDEVEIGIPYPQRDVHLYNRSV